MYGTGLDIDTLYRWFHVILEKCYPYPKRFIWPTARGIEANATNKRCGGDNDSMYSIGHSTARTEVVVKQPALATTTVSPEPNVHRNEHNRSLAEYLISFTPVSGFVYVGVPAFRILIDRYNTGILQWLSCHNLCICGISCWMTRS